MKEYLIYLAGDLFDHKHLAGNLLLARAIESYSEAHYQVVLPQELEQASERSTDIRNNDIRLLAECDLALFNFDGVDLDSGTVVEFVIAKMLNIPCVILRSDFRAAGDQIEGGDSWNLMASGYPNTKKVIVNAMEIYKSYDEAVDLLSEIYAQYARQIVEAFDSLLKTNILWTVPQSKDMYKHLNLMMGSDFLLTEAEIETIINDKLKKDLISNI